MLMDEHDCPTDSGLICLLGSAKRVITWTADTVTPPVSAVLDGVLGFLLTQQGLSAGDDNEPHAETRPSPPAIHLGGRRATTQPSHRLLVTLKQMQMLCDHPDPINRGIEHAVSELTLVVRSFYQLLLTVRNIRGTMDGMEKIILDILLALALYRPVYVWTSDKWQPWTLMDYTIIDDGAKAHLTLFHDGYSQLHLFDPIDTGSRPSVAFELY